MKDNDEIMLSETGIDFQICADGQQLQWTMDYGKRSWGKG